MSASDDDVRDKQAAKEWVDSVSRLQNLIGEKLKQVHFLRSGEDDMISHHLAEVSYMGSVLSERILPEFLRAEGEELEVTVTDLVEDLREMKEAIESMEQELIRLMRHLGR